MRHLTRGDVLVERLLRAARTIAVVEPGRRRGERGRAVFDYLRAAGYDVVPVRADRADVDGVTAFAGVADIPGQVDLVVAYGRPDRDAAIVGAAARKGAEAVWLGPGRATRDAEARARALDIALVKDRDIVHELDRATGEAGRPGKTGVHLRRRKKTYEDDRRERADAGWREAGGGGHRGGGGGRAALDEKKMVAGRPSPRRGALRRRRVA